MPNFDLFINQERYQHCHCRDLLEIYVCHLLKFTTPNKSTIQFIRHIFDISYIQKHTGDFKGQFIENASCLLILNKVFRLFLFHNHDLTSLAPVVDAKVPVSILEQLSAEGCGDKLGDA